MNVVISDQKTGKAYSTKVENPAILLNKKIGTELPLDSIGLSGYTGKITGGSDKCGFPMKADLTGTVRKKIYLTKNKKKGVRKRISVRGNIVAQDIQQVNLVVTKEGTKKLDDLIGKEAKKEEEKKSIKEEMVEKSLEIAGKGLMGDARQTKKEIRQGK